MFYGGSEFGKRKYQKGEISGRAAGFRGHFLGNPTSIFVPVESRDGATLVYIIEEYVAPKTHYRKQLLEGV